MWLKFLFGFSICLHEKVLLIVEFHAIPTEISCLTSLIITTSIPEGPLRCGASYWHSVQLLTLPCSWWVQCSTFSGSLISALVEKGLSNLHRHFMAWTCVWILTMNGCKVKLFHTNWKLCVTVIKKITLILRRHTWTHITVEVPVHTAQWTYFIWLIRLQCSNQTHIVNWLHIFFTKFFHTFRRVIHHPQEGLCIVA
jgi:hypothetical protein